MADIIVDRQRDYPAKVSHYPAASNSEGTNYCFSRSFFLFCSIFSPRTNIYIESIISIIIQLESEKSHRFASSGSMPL